MYSLGAFLAWKITQRYILECFCFADTTLIDPVIPKSRALTAGRGIWRGSQLVFGVADIGGVTQRKIPPSDEKLRVRDDSV